MEARTIGGGFSFAVAATSTASWQSTASGIGPQSTGKSTESEGEHPANARMATAATRDARRERIVVQSASVNVT
jgi:hypothetical protein